MKPIVSYFLRFSNKSRATKSIPVCITVRFNGTTYPYTSGINVTSKEEYNASQKKNPADAVKLLAHQINVARDRAEAIANLMDPYIPDAFSYIIKQAKRECEDILFNDELPFDAYAIASRHLDTYLKTNPGCLVTSIRNPENTSEVPEHLNNYVNQLQNRWLPATIPSLKLPASQHSVGSDGKLVLLENTDANQTSQAPVIINNTIIINGVAGNGPLELPTTKHNPDSNFLTYMMENMDEKNVEGTDNGYSATKNILIRYYERRKKWKFPEGEEPHIAFNQIKEDDLYGFEKWMFEEGKITKRVNGKTVVIEGKGKPMSTHTIKSYLGYMRKTYKLAQDARIINIEENPFAKFTMPDVKDRDISLTDDELKAILEFDLSKDKLTRGGGRKTKEGKAAVRFSREMARDFWILIFLANGINIVDILNKLTWGCIVGNVVSYIRSKTIRKKRFNPIEFELTEGIEYVIDKYGGNDKTPGARIFPFVEEPTPPENLDTMSEKELKAWDKKRKALITKQVNCFTKQVNRYVRKIAEELGYDPKKFTTYSARQTFSNEALKFMKDYMVAKMMGHTGTKTLQKHYANRMDQGVKEIVQKDLSKYVKIPGKKEEPISKAS